MPIVSCCVPLSIAHYCIGPAAMDRISLESSEQSACDKDRLLNSMDGTQSDHGERHRRGQHRPCSRCASRTRLVLTVLPWVLCAALVVGLVVAINNQPPPQQECPGKETMFWRELEFGIAPSPPHLVVSCSLGSLALPVHMSLSCRIGS